jgi:hypothetical protein
MNKIIEVRIDLTIFILECPMIPEPEVLKSIFPGKSLRN